MSYKQALRQSMAKIKVNLDIPTYALSAVLAPLLINVPNSWKALGITTYEKWNALDRSAKLAFIDNLGHEKTILPDKAFLRSIFLDGAALFARALIWKLKNEKLASILKEFDSEQFTRVWRKQKPDIQCRLAEHCPIIHLPLAIMEADRLEEILKDPKQTVDWKAVSQLEDLKRVRKTINARLKGEKP